MMHQSEFHAASVALSRAADKRKSLIDIHYHCRSAMICRDDLELRWRLLMCENEFSHISLLLYISAAF